MTVGELRGLLLSYPEDMLIVIDDADEGNLLHITSFTIRENMARENMAVIAGDYAHRVSGNERPLLHG